MASIPPLGRERPSETRRIVHLSVTLLLLFGLTYLTMSVNPPELGAGRITILIGFVLLVANLAGGLATSTGLPRLTGFLLVGILAGPSALGMLSQQSVDDLRLIDEFALTLIAMLAGGELKIGELRHHAKTIGLTTLAVTGIVWVGVAGTVVALRPLLPFLADLPVAASVGIALVLGVWAANSSPDLTVAVIEETGEKGPLAEVILGITIVKDVFVIVLFTLTLALVAPLVDPNEAFNALVLVDLAREVGGAIVLGGIMGWAFSLYLGDEETPRPPLATFLFAYVIVVIAHRLHVELLLTGVAAGFVIENLSPAGDTMIRGIESVSVVIFAFFFAIAGAGLDLGALRTFWLAALVLFSVRLLLTWLGARYGTKMSGASELIRSRTWQGLISQGGVTLGLVLLIRERFPTLGDGIVALGMAVIVGNILGGPIILKQALAGAAEVGKPGTEPREPEAEGA
jgi:Kef-type K+ transport system membrane component KefB